MKEQFCWLLGGSQMQYPMAHEIKQRGYKLLLTDANPDCLCRPLADQFKQISVYDINANLRFAYHLPKPFRDSIKAVLTVATDAGVEVASLAEYLGVPGVPTYVARRIHSKSQCRLILGFDSPQFYITSRDDKTVYEQWQTYPCVVKADNNSGSKGFSVVRSPDELQAAIRYAADNNRRGGIVVVEEYLEDVDVAPEFEAFDTSEVAVEFFVIDSQVHFANGALRLFWKDRPGIEAGHFNPFTPDDSIMAMADRVAKKFGLQNGILKMDLKHTAGGWRLLETACRLSGGYDHMVTCPLATGKNITGAMLDLALGEPLDPDKLKAKRNYHACCYAPVYEPGKVSGWEGLEGDELIFCTATGEIKPLKDNACRPLFVIRDGKTRQEALEAAMTVAEKMRPVYV